MSGGYVPKYEPDGHPCESTDTTRKHSGWTYQAPPAHPELGWRCLAHLIQDVQDSREGEPEPEDKA